jgi:hypothetical protein
MAGRDSVDDPYHFYAAMPQRVQDHLEIRGYDVKMAQAMQDDSGSMALDAMIAIAGSWDATLCERYGPYDVVAKRYKHSDADAKRIPNISSRGDVSTGVHKALKPAKHHKQGKRCKYPCQVHSKNGVPCVLDHTNGEHWQLMHAG